MPRRTGLPTLTDERRKRKPPERRSTALRMRRAVVEAVDGFKVKTPGGRRSD